MQDAIANMIIGSFITGTVGLLFWLLRNAQKRPPEYVEVKECELRRENMATRFDMIDRKMDDIIEQQRLMGTKIDRLVGTVAGE